MAVTTLLLLGFFAFLILRATAPQMAPLYSGLNFDDSSAIVAELRTQNVDYELRGDGETILVPRNKIPELRMSLAESGLPTQGQVGYEIFDEQSTLGATSFVQNINQVRALEGELARTISSLNRIKSTRVHLVLPERELFQRERQDPSASIMVSTRGELSSGEIRAIQTLVASSIENLSPNRVSIVDDTGRLLASGTEVDETNMLASQVEERTLGMEQRMRTRIEDMLADIVGAGRARAQVALELNMDRSTTTEETYDPDGQVVRSTQTRETNDASQTPNQNTGVSVSTELPDANAQGTDTGLVSEQSDTTEETVNYEISRKTQTSVSEAGGIKRLSVAVVVDGLYTEDGQGNAVYNPRSDAELQQLTALVRSAVGFDEARGDTVEVVNMQFAERPNAQGDGTSQPGMFDFTRDDIMNFANMGVTLIIALALLLFVLRPLLKRVLEPEAEPLAIEQATEIHEQGEATGQLPAPAEMENSEWLDNARALGDQHMATLRSVGTLVEENPKQATIIVRDWLNQAA